MPFPRPNPRLQPLLRSGCLLAVVLVGVCGQAEDAGEIVPIRFADLDSPESAPVEVLMIPSVIVEDDLVPNESVAPAEPALAAEPAPLEEVSSRAADGLRIQDFGVEETQAVQIHALEGCFSWEVRGRGG